MSVEDRLGVVFYIEILIDMYTTIMEGFVRTVAQLYILAHEARALHNTMISPRRVYPVPANQISQSVALADKMYDVVSNADTGNTELDEYIKHFICAGKDGEPTWYTDISGNSSKWQYEDIDRGIYRIAYLITEMVIKVSKDNRFNKAMKDDRDAEIDKLKHRVELLEKAVNPMPDYDYEEYTRRIAPFKDELIIVCNALKRIIKRRYETK